MNKYEVSRENYTPVPFPFENQDDVVGFVILQDNVPKYGKQFLTIHEADGVFAKQQDGNGEFVFGPNVFRVRTIEELVLDGYNVAQAKKLWGSPYSKEYFEVCLVSLNKPLLEVIAA